MFTGQVSAILQQITRKGEPAAEDTFTHSHLSWSPACQRGSVV